MEPRIGPLSIGGEPDYKQRKVFKLKVKGPDPTDAYKKVTEPIARAKIDRIITCCKLYQPLATDYLSSNCLKKDIEVLNKGLKGICKIIKQEEDIPPLPAIEESNRFFTLMEAIKGEDLYERRETDHDLVVNVYGADHNLLTSEFAHRAQLEPFSSQFHFSVNPNRPQAYILNLNFEGNQEEFQVLLHFFYTGKIEARELTPSFLDCSRKFREAYSIELLKRFDQYQFEKQSIVEKLRKLSASSTWKEAYDQLNSLLEAGYGADPITVETIKEIHELELLKKLENDEGDRSQKGHSIPD